MRAGDHERLRRREFGRYRGCQVETFGQPYSRDLSSSPVYCTRCRREQDRDEGQLDVRGPHPAETRALAAAKGREGKVS